MMRCAFSNKLNPKHIIFDGSLFIWFWTFFLFFSIKEVEAVLKKKYNVEWKKLQYQIHKLIFNALWRLLNLCIRVWHGWLVTWEIWYQVFSIKNVGLTCIDGKRLMVGTHKIINEYVEWFGEIPV